MQRAAVTYGLKGGKNIGLQVPHYIWDVIIIYYRYVFTRDKYNFLKFDKNTRKCDFFTFNMATFCKVKVV